MNKIEEKRIEQNNNKGIFGFSESEILEEVKLGACPTAAGLLVIAYTIKMLFKEILSHENNL